MNYYVDTARAMEAYTILMDHNGGTTLLNEHLTSATLFQNAILPASY